MNDKIEITQKEIESRIYSALKAPFPSEAYSCDSSRGFDLTSIRAQYIPDRLNSVVGLMNWNFSGEIEIQEGGVLYRGILQIVIGIKKREVIEYGWSKKKTNLGDTYKSAMTDSLGKCASKIGVGDAVFKGLVAPPKSGGNYKKPIDPNVEYIFTFGKHKGKLISAVDSDYILFLGTSDKTEVALKDIFRAELQKRKG